ncbi:hypothetical protein B5G40_12545 [Flavonifractor sp. An9]|nr:hypothetical protein B5G40_12545 [Flavonifractor sp. An9]
MEIWVSEQALFLLGAVGLGAAAGLIYDLLRILRVRLPLPLIGGLMDLLFWLVVTAAIFVYSTVAGRGQVRGYLLAGILAGGGVYFWALSRGFLWLGYRLADLVGVVWHIVTLPLVVMGKVCKKIGKSAKKAFHYRPKWYKINTISDETEDTPRSDRAADGEGVTHETQESIPSDQTRHPGAAHRHGHRPADHAQSAPGRSGRSGRRPTAGGGAEASQRRPGRRRGKQRRSGPAG